MMIKGIRGRLAPANARRRAAAMAVAAALASFAGGAYAFEIDTGNPDIAMRWDNTFRYNLGMRVEGRDQNIGNYSSPTKARTASTRTRSSPTASTCSPSSISCGASRSASA
jgi:hypothetical protein